MRTVTWRQSVAVLLAAVLSLSALVVVFRSDGIPAVDAVAARATRWFVHQDSGRVVLVDGFGGRALASLDTTVEGASLKVVEGGPGAYLVDSLSASVRSIDSAELRLGATQDVPTLQAGNAVTGLGSSGLVIVETRTDAATLVPVAGEAVSFDAAVDDDALVAADGSIWSVVSGDVVRVTSAASTARSLDGADGDTVALSLVGSRPFVVDRDGKRARLGDGDWIALPTAIDGSEIVTQVQGPANSCGWIAANDDLWCVSDVGIEETARIDGLDVDGSDLLAVAGDAAALIRRGPTEVQRFDWRSEELIFDQSPTIEQDAVLEIISTIDLIWVNDIAGDFVWAVNPWGIVGIDKDDSSTLVLGDDGRIVDDGEGSSEGSDGPSDGTADANEERKPDNNGIDDPPVANDDPVTSRTGRIVNVPVTANDYDPDGEAIAVVETGRAGHGTVEIATATTVTFTPEPGYVGLDRFTYTITDGSGQQDTAEVIVELIPLDGANQPPVGAPDTAETGAGVPVIVDVLVNDIDPDRDPIQIESFTAPSGIGEVTATEDGLGLQALKFQPLEGFEGVATFSYRPMDSFGALGDEVPVTVSVARAGDENRPPIARPDSIRLRRNDQQPLQVLLNDEDPDGDRLRLDATGPFPDGLDVQVEGEVLQITVSAGSADTIPFTYKVTDGFNPPVQGSVLVNVIDDEDPNRPPQVLADSATAVVGRSIEIDALSNDSDPDSDPLVIVAVSQPEDERGNVLVVANKIQFDAAVLDDEEDSIARFTYTVDDGNGHQVVGDVTVTVLPESLPEPPFALDDTAFTLVDVPVVIDVLGNDGDPSGEVPKLRGTPGCPGGGMVVVTSGSRVRFTPPLGRSGDFSCTYEVSNSAGLRAAASIFVTVREPIVTNTPPRAVLDQWVVEVDGEIARDVTDNDDDPDGDNSLLEVVSSTPPSVGSATRDGNIIRYTAGSEPGVTGLSYQVVDEEGAISTGRVSITVTPRANQRPVALPDSRVITAPGVPTQFSLLDNDSDPDDPKTDLSVSGVSIVSGSATATLNGAVLVISPDPSFIGDVVATYTITDPGGLSSTAFVTLTIVEPENRPPIANDDANDVTNGGSVTTPVLFNDSDPDGDPLSLSIVRGADSSLGQARVNGGSIAFTATPGAAGTAEIGYAVSDGEFSDEATLRISVRACAQSAPTAADAFLATGYEQPIMVNLAAYAANGQITDVAAPAGYANDVYTPPAGENGNVTITYAVVNNCRQRAVGTVTIDVNQDPVPQPVATTLGRGATREFPVSNLAGDDEALIITGIPGAPAWATSPSPSVVVVAPPVGTPAGTYDWTVVVADPGGLIANVGMSVTVENAVPSAINDSVDVSGGPVTAPIVDNDIDPDASNTALRLQSIPTSLDFSNGESGTITAADDQRSVIIDPGAGLGTASFTYTVVDADGGVSEPAMVTVLGASANTAPTATDQSVDASVGVPTTVVLDVDDVDGDVLSVIEVDNSDAVVSSITGTSITVSSTEPGTFTFTYRVTDGVLESSDATVTIVVTTPTTTTLPPTTLPPTTLPPTTLPPTTLPPTTLPPTTLPPTTLPPTTLPPTTLPPTPTTLPPTPTTIP